MGYKPLQLGSDITQNQNQSNYTDLILCMKFAHIDNFKFC